MTIKNKFLILEDVDTDAEMIMDEVKLAFPESSYKRVENEPDFIKELKTFKPDLVLADYSLPTYNGMAALKHVLVNSPHTPVILVTGSINEDTAVACMRTGAVDYVLKDKMSRLGLAIKTALENKKIKIERQQAILDLENSEKYYRSILKYMHDEIVVISKNYIITDINNSMLKVTGQKREEIIGKPCYKVLHGFDSPCFNHGLSCYHQAVINSGKIMRYQRISTAIEGEEKWMDIIVSPLFDENHNITNIIESYREITDLVKAQEEIKKLSTVVKQSPVAVVLMDIAGIIKYVNPAFTKLTGYNSEEILGKLLDTIGAEGITKEEHRLILKDSLSGKLKKKIFKNRKKSGEIFYTSSKFAQYHDSSGKLNGLITMMIDITQSVQDKQQLEDNLNEKELLLHEIYHRVNNNMQIMISLFNMQIQRTDLQSEKDILTIAQSRIGAMSAIHNDIYQERSFSSINFKSVIQYIFDKLIESFVFEYGQIILNLDVEIDNFGLDLAQPAALIVNELLSNILRYAYPNGKGNIYVKMFENKTNEITLIVRDEGIGLPPGLDHANAETTGFSLVYMLGEGQLDGNVDFNTDNGTIVTVKFKRIEDKKRF